MRKTATHFILPILCLLLTSCSAQEKPSGDCLTIEGGDTHEFGSITHGDKPSHAFVFHNACEDTVRFTAVKASCSCTAALPDRELLPPGESTEIKVTFYPPRSTNGHVQKSVSVYVDDEARPRFLLRVEADIESGFTATPEKVDLGSVPVGAPAEATLRLENISGETREIVAVQCVLSIEFRGENGDAAPQVVPVTNAAGEPASFTLEAGAARDLTVRFTPQMKGKLMGSVVIYSGPEARQVEFTGTVH